ncbi:MAG: DUF2235 domain-containing protein [Candidatus Sabulitectum sp.]|nr:DUF2235 domain-containing protein [Candidatus Sabulitectum sp.]
MKSLIFCSDGTSNTQKDRTNVFQLFEMLEESPRQLKAYDRGVGTKFGNITRGCAFGVGLHFNILDGFKFISSNYEQGDRIYLFGFSRGAYTVRSLASMIALCGLAPKDASGKTVKKFWKAYTSNRNAEKFALRTAELKRCCTPIRADVEAVCVWDTVGSIGSQTRTKNIRKKLAHRYHRMTVYPEVHRIYHAVSIDERRTQFYPHLLFAQTESLNTQVEEVWFAGVHSDIGGGYSHDDSSLGDIALKWMISRIENELVFKSNSLAGLNLDSLGRMHNAEGGFLFSLFRKRNRPIRRGSVLHQSVLERIAKPPHEYQQHREPSGNYSPFALTFCNFATPPDFGITDNYKITQ